VAETGIWCYSALRAVRCFPSIHIHDMIWHDMTCHGMAWHGIALHYITLHYIAYIQYICTLFHYNIRIYVFILYLYITVTYSHCISNMIDFWFWRCLTGWYPQVFEHSEKARVQRDRAPGIPEGPLAISGLVTYVVESWWSFSEMNQGISDTHRIPIDILQIEWSMQVHAV
jgi:hypothetical protein